MLPKTISNKNKNLDQPILYITKLLYLCIVVRIGGKDMKWNELRKYAELKGWVLKRHGKQHDIYYHPDKEYFIQLERHEAVEVRNGILKRLLKQINN